MKKVYSISGPCREYDEYWMPHGTEEQAQNAAEFFTDWFDELFDQAIDCEMSFKVIEVSDEDYDDVVGR